MVETNDEPAASRWADRHDVLRGDEYDSRWAAMQESGQSLHGEADFLCGYDPKSVLDAGCGTGRVAIELALRGIDVAGVDLDEAMLTAARQKAPEIDWKQADLASVDVGRTFEIVAMPGNVMIFVAAGTEGVVVANLARHLTNDGLLIAGFELQAAGLTLKDYDGHCRSAGLHLVERFATWGREPYSGGSYAVSVHRAGSASV